MQGADVFFQALEDGNIHQVRSMLQSTPALSSADIGVRLTNSSHKTDGLVCNQSDWTAVQAAASLGKADIIRLLHEFGSDLNKPRENGCTPLYIAAANGHIEAVTTLHELGANINTPATNGATSVFVAAEFGHVDVLLALHSFGADVNASKFDDGGSPVYMATQQGHTEILRTLHQLGADIHKPLFNGDTPLMVAASHGQVGTLQLLIQYGAVLGARNLAGQTAHDWAANQEIIEILDAVMARALFVVLNFSHRHSCILLPNESPGFESLFGRRCDSDCGRF
eukprot:c17242_g1_i2.p1 GENE.c17242_g1_i2~~c17242_g1_i2.p1  ORF type:complete len:282 (+),score=48.19 c17242_g1_i2:33-878(+)